MITSRAEAAPVLLDVAPVGWLDPIPSCQLCGGNLVGYADITRNARRCDQCYQRWIVR